MIPLGLSAAALAQLQATLSGSHSIHVTVQVLTHEGERLADLSWRLLDGQVNMDALAEVTRSCTLSLLDPNRTMAFDSDSPSGGALYLNRMIQVNYSVRSPGRDWVTIPVFTGPVVKLDRTDDVVNIEAQGKELLALGAVWQSRTYTKGWRKVDVIQSILQTRAGETKFSFPEISTALPLNYTIGRETTSWAAARHVASGLGLNLFYDGRGVCRLEPYPQASVFHFKTGDGGTVLSQPQISYSTDSLKNIVLVRGGTPGGGRVTIQHVSVAPSSHPLSPTRLGRNGVPRYLLETVENSSIVTQSEAKYVADTTLNRSLLEEVSVSFDAIPIPHLEPWDVARLYTDEFNNAFRMSKVSLPLTSKGTMSVGYLNRVSVGRTRGWR